MTRCPCGFPRDVCWRCSPPPAMDMDEDKDGQQTTKEVPDHDRDDEDAGDGPRPD